MQIDTLAERYDLGALVSSHGWYRPVYRQALFAMLFFLPFALLAAALIIGIPILIVMIVYLVIVIRRMTTSRQIFFVYERGVIDCRKSRPEVIKYSEIADLWFWNRLDIALFVKAYREEYKVKMLDGKVHHFIQTISGIRKVGDYLQSQVLQHQFPKAIARLNQDESIPFVNLRLRRDGVQKGKKFLSWRDIETVGIETFNGSRHRVVSLVIRQRGAKYAWAVYSRESFPNLTLFLMLVEQMRSPQDSRGECHSPVG